MELMVLFDCATSSKQYRRECYRWRKTLKKSGFTMLQYSVYVRHVNYSADADVLIEKLKSKMPDKSDVKFIKLSDSQSVSLGCLCVNEDVLGIL